MIRRARSLGAAGAGTGLPGRARAAGAAFFAATVLTPACACGGTGEEVVLVGAGDVGECKSPGDEATADLLDEIEGTVFTLGDNVYPDGSPDDFLRCYAGTWGRHRLRTRPAPGNHEYDTPGAAGYFRYFGAAAGEPGRGWYGYDAGAWRVIVLNSNCADVPGGCGAGSPQERWLREELATHRPRCTLAMWHHPLFTSAERGAQAPVGAFWRALYETGADVILTAHEHYYERFVPLDPAGGRDPQRGMRQFIVGTGGGLFAPVPGARAPGSEVLHVGVWGVLKLTLQPAGYEWEFVPAAGRDLRDRGSDRCH